MASLTKEEQTRQRFLQMAQKFNWNLPKPTSHKGRPSNHNQNTVPNPSFHFPKEQISNPNHNTDTITQNVNNSIYDSEATESEENTFVYQKHTIADNNTNNLAIPTHNTNHIQTPQNTESNTNRTNQSGFIRNFSTPIKNFDKIHKKRHNSFIKQHMRSATKSILESPIPSNRINRHSKNRNHKIITPNPNANISNSNHGQINTVLINRSQFEAITNSNNNDSSNNSSLLTQENLSKHNRSQSIERRAKSLLSAAKTRSNSLSSVLSKHAFQLLEVSCSESETETANIQNELSFLDLTNVTPLPKTNKNNPKSQYFTDYTHTTKKNAKYMFGQFLDLCSDESDANDRQTPLPFIEDSNECIPSLPIQTPLIETKKNQKINNFQTTQITKKRKKIILNKKRQNILQTVKLNKNTKILCDEVLSAKEFKKQREQYTLWFFRKINAKAFDAQLKLNENITYKWCNTLNKTAGDCRLITQNKIRKAHIRLATKVLDTLEKLKQTLCHEMCHACAWIVHSCRKPPHGSNFRYWANKAELVFNDITVTTCHNYQIRYKFQWKCVRCGYLYGRHSKSIKENTHKCGLCQGKLEYLGRLRPDGSYTITKKRSPSKFTLFMKEHMSAIKKQYPGATHGYVMKILSEKYKLERNGKITPI